MTELGLLPGGRHRLKIYATAVWILLFVLCSMVFSPTLALACSDHEYEQCWRVDLGPLGEAKDCKCVPKIGGDVGRTAEQLKPTVAQLAAEIQKSPEAMQECIRDVQKCAIQIISAPLAAPIQLYIDALYKQSQGRVHSFSPEFVSLVQPYYEVNVSQLTFANDVDTGHGMTVAYCDRIFFVGHGNVWTDRNELFHVLHELEHTVQCQKRGATTYLAEYVLKASAAAVQSGRLNVHDVIDYEVAADSKANALVGQLWTKIQTRAVPIPGGNSGQTPGSSPTGLAVGSIIQGCGCWGPAMGAVATPACQSGYASPQMCNGMCMGGGFPYGFVCQ